MRKIKLFEDFSVDGFLDKEDIPEFVKGQIDVIEVRYLNFSGDIKTGKIVCHKSISKDLLEIFDRILEIKFPIYSISPVSEFSWDDMESVRANNSSCFNWRFVIGSNKLSDHALGLAMDINPMENPWVHPSAHVIPGRKYDLEQKGTIEKGSQVVDIFKEYGFKWGGDWRNPDYQHFFKPSEEIKNKIISIL